jgi:hypothetical protein
LLNGHFSFADPAKNSLCIPFRFAPDRGIMPGYFFMTFKTGIVLAAAFELYCNDVKGRMIMNAARIIIKHVPIYFFLIHSDSSYH